MARPAASSNSNSTPTTAITIPVEDEPEELSPLPFDASVAFGMLVVVVSRPSKLAFEPSPEVELFCSELTLELSLVGMTVWSLESESVGGLVEDLMGEPLGLMFEEVEGLIVEALEGLTFG